MKARDSEQLALSVIIATYNRVDLLRACLMALSCQTESSDRFEVVVVVDGATDETMELLQSIHMPCRLRSTWQPNHGQAAALNRGILMATGTYCLFLDDDIVAEPGLVAAHIRTQGAGQGVIGVGHLACSIPGNAEGLTRYFAEWWAGHFEHLGQRRRALSPLDCFSGNLSVPRSDLVAVGGFAVDLPRYYDIELAYLLGSRGLSAVYIPDAGATQQYRKDFQAIVADAEKEGMAEVELWRRHPGLRPELRLGRLSAVSRRELLLLDLLLRAEIPARILERLAVFLPVPAWRYRWYRFLYGYCFHRGARRAFTGSQEQAPRGA